MIATDDPLMGRLDRLEVAVMRRGLRELHSLAAAELDELAKRDR